MSFGSSAKGFGIVQEVLTLGLIVITMIALFYFDFDFTLKIGIAVLAFTIVVLINSASQLLNIQKEASAKAQK